MHIRALFSHLSTRVLPVLVWAAMSAGLPNSPSSPEPLRKGFPSLGEHRLSTMGPYYCFWNTIMCVFFPKNEQKIPKKQTKIRHFCFHFQKLRHCRISFSFHCLFSKPCPISCCWKRGNQVEKTGKWTWKIWELRMFELQHLQCNFVIWIEWNCLWLCQKQPSVQIFSDWKCSQTGFAYSHCLWVSLSHLSVLLFIESMTFSTW